MFNGKMKALTFSFDDGNDDDVKVVEILNKYGLKSTFNLSSGKLTYSGSWIYNETKEVHHINYTDWPHLYDGHEIACHGYTHPDLLYTDDRTAYNELFLDKKLLEYLYDCKIEGAAYPYGTYDDRIISILEKLGILYSRTVNSTLNFELPERMLTLHPTCHWLDEQCDTLADEFIKLKPEAPKLFYIWGHGFELSSDERIERLESLCRKLSGRDDIYYCTNIEAVKSITEG